MMREQHADPAGLALAPVLVRRQRFGRVVGGDELQRSQVGSQRRFGRVRLQPDKADPRQHVITGQQQVLRFLVQAQMPWRMAGSPDCPPAAG
jgi:hypothetical protein